MNELASANIYAGVTDIAGAGIEAKNISRLQVRGINMNAVCGLVLGNTVKSNAEMLIYVIHKP